MSNRNVIELPIQNSIQRPPLSAKAAEEAAIFARHIHQMRGHLESERRMRIAMPTGSVRDFKLAEIEYLSDDLESMAACFLRVLEQRP